MKATEKSTSRRAVLTALAAVVPAQSLPPAKAGAGITAGSAAQAAPVECPELRRLYGEMLAISAEWDAIPLPYSTDEQADHYSDRLAALEERIIATPAATLADVVLKLRVFRRYERDMPAPPMPHEELWEITDSEDPSEDRLLCSIARDIHAFAGREPAGGRP